MRNIWLVAKHEYLKIVRKKSFLLGTLGVPVLIVVVMTVSIIVAVGQRGTKPVGYVDKAGVLSEAIAVPPRRRGKTPVPLLPFDDEATARAALDVGDIQAYYVLPEDYVQSGRLQLFYLKKRPSEVVGDDFADFLRANLLAGQPDEVQRRLLAGTAVTFRAVDGSREFDSGDLWSFVAPFVVASFFVFAVMNSGSYMLQAVTDEKVNRTIEILATSVRPEALIGGKALGLMSVGLTQLSLWAFTGVIAVWVASPFVPSLQALHIPGAYLGVVALFFVPTYALIAGMMTAVGGIVTDLRQGQQITGLFNMLFTVPFFFAMLIMAKPNNPIIILLTLFPTTAFVTIALRWSMTTVPLWQLAISLTLLVASAIVSVWMAARIFRIGMLRYGQQLSVKSIIASLRGKGI